MKPIRWISLAALAAAVLLSSARLSPAMPAIAQDSQFPTLTPIPPTLTPLPTGSTLFVTKLEDTNDGVCDADCSLREAVSNAPENARIIISAKGLFQLKTGLEINKSLSIVGSGDKASDIILSGGKISTTVVDYRTGRARENVHILLENFTVENTGIFNTWAAITTKDMVFKDSSVGIHNRLGKIFIDSSTFINVSRRSVDSLDGYVELLNTTILSINSSIAVSTTRGKLKIINSTLYGKINLDLAGTSVEVINSTLVSIQYGRNCKLFILPTVQTTIAAQNSLQYPDDSCGSQIAVADPMLLPLADMGGKTPVMPLAEGSPAINAGNNFVCQRFSQSDQTGLDRIGICDIGAFEFRQKK